MIALSAGAEISFGGEITMNTDKIYAEAIANEYAPKEASKVLALKKLDMKAKSKANIFASCCIKAVFFSASVKINSHRTPHVFKIIVI